MWKDSIGGLAGKPVEQLGKAVRDVMRRGVQVCQLNTPVSEIVDLMAKRNADALVVVDADGEAVGIVTDQEAMRAYMGNLSDMTAEEVMAPKAQVVAPDTLVAEAVQVMLDRKVRHLLIKGEHVREVPVGIVSAADIVREMAGLPAVRPQVDLKKSRQKTERG